MIVYQLRSATVAYTNVRYFKEVSGYFRIKGVAMCINKIVAVISHHLILTRSSTTCIYSHIISDRQQHKYSLCKNVCAFLLHVLYTIVHRVINDR